MSNVKIEGESLSLSHALFLSLYFSRTYTHILLLTSATFPDVLKNPQFPEKWPFYPEDFKRQDESDDTNFYETPRLVYHIDDPAVAALTKYYAQTFTPGASVLDICSSWVSHFPNDVKLGNRVGLGMNKNELKQNKQLDDFVVQNLNENPIFPFPKDSFDFVTCVVSIDYLTRPLEIFSEINRVLKPGYSLLCTFL